MDRRSSFILLIFLYLVIGVAGCVAFFCVPSIQLPLSGAFSTSATGNAMLSAPSREQEESSTETLPTLPELPDLSTREAATPSVADAELEYTYTAIHQSSKLHIRDGASLDAEIIGFLNQGESGSVIRIEGDWVLLEHGDLEGYVYKKYLKLEERP